MLRRESECVSDGAKESHESDEGSAQALRWSKCQQRRGRRSIGPVILGLGHVPEGVGDLGVLPSCGSKR